MQEQIKKYVGKKVSAVFGGLTFEVEILDVKRSYGMYRYQVTPVAGKGTVWIESFNEITKK